MKISFTILFTVALASSLQAQDSTNVIASTNAVVAITNSVSPFQLAVNDYQQKGNKWSDGERVAQQSALLDTLPPISEEARRHFISGQAILKQATSTNDFLDAAHEFYQANTNAPWVANIWYEMAASREAAHQYEYALHCIKIYQMFKLSPDDARDAQDRLYQIQAEKDLAAKHAADEQAKEQEEARAKEQALEKFLGKWDNGNGFYLQIFGPRSAQSWGSWGNAINMNDFQIAGQRITFTVKFDSPRLPEILRGVFNYDLTISEDGTHLVGTAQREDGQGDKMFLTFSRSDH